MQKDETMKNMLDLASDLFSIFSIMQPPSAATQCIDRNGQPALLNIVGRDG